jgi:virulence factor Mce-like protein
VIAVICFFGFTKDIPFTHGYVLKAQFESANSIRPNSPVRIAGVDVGKVKKIEPLQGTNSAVLVMELKHSALPIHQDATAKIRPRIFLEGNFFVDLKPGTPEAPQMHSGDTLKISQTATPVQLDQVLTSLQSDSREDLKSVLDGVNTALNTKQGGKTAAQSFNDAYDDIPPAERSTAQVLEALLGTEPGRDVSRLIRGTALTAEALDRNESQLQGLITNLNTTMAAFASESGNLSASVRELAPTLRNANAALDSLNAAFPPTRAFAREILPGVRETPATIQAAFPWIDQVRALVSPAELQGLANDLRPAVDDLAQLTDDTVQLLPKVDDVSRCFIENILPTGDIVINVPGYPHVTGVENYKEFWQSQVALSGESQNFDGNGQYTRFQPGGGTQTLSTGNTRLGGPPMFANPNLPSLGSIPKYPARKPPYRRDVKCYENALPRVNENAVMGSPGP